MRSLIALGVVLAVTVAILVGLALLLGSLSSDAEDGESIDREPLTIVTREGDIFRLEVEIAETREEHGVGLSGRESVPEGTGMLFVMPSRLGFWMKDTSVPLSVAFLARCGEILDIKDMEPETMEVHTTDQPYDFGLEVPRGWFAGNGIEVGDIVSIPRDHRPDGC